MAASVTLRVAETTQQDVGSGRARIDTKTRMELGLSPGDIIEVHGTKTTAAVVWRLFQADEGRGLIRIDGLIRKNAGVSMGDKVTIAKAEVQKASKVGIGPLLPDNQRLKFGPGFETFVKGKLKNRPLMRGDMIFIPGIALMGGALPFTVVATAPKGIVQVDEETEIGIKEEAVREGAFVGTAESYEDIGGLAEELRRVREMIELPLKHPELFERLGIEAPKGVLLHGPPGTGKTLIAKAVANESGAAFFSIQGPEIMSKYYGESERMLRDKFEEAAKAAPSIIFIDELDSIAPKREETQGEVERRVVAQLLTLMDGLSGRGKVIVIGATNRVDAIDGALRRPGRFDREIEIGVPDRSGRLEILQVHCRGMPLVEGFKIDRFVDATHGFVGADLQALVREAAMKTLRRYLPEIDLDKPMPQEVLERMQVTEEDFRDALREIEPSSLRDVFVEVPQVHWDDVGGLDDVKEALRETVELPLTNPQAFTDKGIRPVRGVLLYGPPGTGKTMLAKAVATESAANFISIKGPEVLSKWLGDSERAVREIFKKARQAAPCVVFLDEIDSLAPGRGTGDRTAERVVNQLLTSMDGLERLEGVSVIAATNRPDILDPAILRPGRLDRLILVGPPTDSGRLQILKVHTRSVPLAPDVDLEGWANRLSGFVGADLEGVVREAAMRAIKEGTSTVTEAHFTFAANKVRGSCDDATLKYYQVIKERLEGGIARRQKKDDIGMQYS